jgi:hypothetical protein
MAVRVLLSCGWLVLPTTAWQGNGRWIGAGLVVGLRG